MTTSFLLKFKTICLSTAGQQEVKERKEGKKPKKNQKNNEMTFSIVKR